MIRQLRSRPFSHWDTSERSADCMRRKSSSLDSTRCSFRAASVLASRQLGVSPRRTRILISSRVNPSSWARRMKRLTAASS
jgi:hypothetical protein